MSKVDDLAELIYKLHRQFPDWPSTFGDCPTEGCNEGGRGGGLCKHCITEKIGEIVGFPEARRYLFKLQEVHSIRCNIYEIADKYKED